ncbi:MOSC N-terminal beta barrel domain-containing protein [Lentzea sp. NPDC004782]|uniref:MOSC domain-containing protein n=1 Tax=Lentzea sp. NPDC004782 TaxID=3154458 RepID=UPI0033B64B80
MAGVVVTGLWRYPVKSVGGEQVERLRFTADGVQGDRAFAIATRTGGRVLTARRSPELLEATARRLGDAVELTLPDGSTVHSDDPESADRLSDWLHLDVELRRPSGQAVQVEEYLTESAKLASFELPQWGFVDESPVHVLSEDLLAQGREWHPDGVWDVRRFRPNVVLSAGELPQRGPIAAGRVLLDVTGPCRRCVMISMAQRGLAKDRELLRAVVTRSDKTFGVYANVLRTGVVCTGDQVATPEAEPGFVAVSRGERGIR